MKRREIAMHNSLKAILISLLLSYGASAAFASGGAALSMMEEHVAGHVIEENKIEKAAQEYKKNNKTPEEISRAKYDDKTLQPTPAVSSQMAQAALINTTGKVVGRAVFWQGTKGVLIKLFAEGLTPWAHGLHIHETGTCQNHDAFAGAKGHMMESEAQGIHGFLHPEGPHAGDLPNIIAHDDGTAHVELYSESFRIHLDRADMETLALLDEDGSSLMIHAGVDDYISQPSGASGGRVVCGIITKQ
jgi:Cu-Zn family superoxide dismutase